MADTITSEELRVAEFRKLESETARNEAERAKASAEEREILRRVEERWYVPRVMFRQGFAGIVAGILFTIWGIGVIRPLVLQKTVEAEHTNKIIELTHRRERLEIARENDRLKAENERNEKDFKELSEQSKALREERERAIKATEALSAKFDIVKAQSEALAAQFDSTSEQNETLTDLAREAEVRAVELKSQLGDLQQAQATATEQAKRIDISRQIRGLAIRIFHSPARADEARQLKSRLVGLGTSVTLYNSKAYTDLNHSAKLTYKEAQSGSAEQLRILLEDQIKFDKVSVASSDKPADVFIHIYGQ